MRIGCDDLTESFYAKLNGSQIPALDGIRAIAVLLVVFYHFGIGLGFYALPGYLGVLMFFVLSGFLITWLLLRENEKTGTVSLKSFYLRRVLRIFPAFYAYWFFTVGVRLVTHHEVAWFFAIAAFLYLSNYAYAVNYHEPTMMMQTWSLAIEEQFYFLWPLAFKRFAGSLTKLSAVLSGAILTVWIYRAALRLIINAPRIYIEYAFDTRIDALLFGCLLAVLLKRRAINGVISKLTAHWTHAFVPIVVLVLNTFVSEKFGMAYSQVAGYCVEEICVAALLVQMVSFSDVAPWNFLNLKPMRFIGRLSYSLYLYHGMSFQYLPGSLRNAVMNSGTAVKVLCGLAMSFAFATTSYFCIEKVFLKWKK